MKWRKTIYVQCSCAYGQCDCVHERKSQRHTFSENYLWKISYWNLKKKFWKPFWNPMKALKIKSTWSALWFALIHWILCFWAWEKGIWKKKESSTTWSNFQTDFTDHWWNTVCLLYSLDSIISFHVQWLRFMDECKKKNPIHLVMWWRTHKIIEETTQKWKL